MERVDLYNQISREIVKNYNSYLHVEDVKILNTLETSAHYTISHVIDKPAADKLHQVALKLKELDASLILYTPANYHVTLFWRGLESRLEEKVPEIEQIIKNTNFEFDIQELLFGPLGISVKFYPKNEEFVRARTAIHKLTNTPILIDERFVTTWVSLAAYSQIPHEIVKKYIQENSNMEFGPYKPESFTLYISTNKGLVNPKVVKEFKCKLQ